MGGPITETQKAGLSVHQSSDENKSQSIIITSMAPKNAVNQTCRATQKEMDGEK